uniref:Cold shock domain-containing protein n=1 Tax=Astatotilapia calliptera TaxID=8154 RepID=A0AAX7SSI3_ASTCA
MGPPGWGPPPPGGWGPPPPGGWPPPPDDWDLIGPPPPGGWGPRGPPPHGAWGPRGPPPPDWDPRGPLPPDWGPRGPPLPDWHGRGPPPPDWDPRGPPPPGWGPEDWDWDRRADYWRPLHPEADWRGPDRPLPPPGWGHPGWDPEGPPEPWGPEPIPPAPIPPVAPPVVPPVPPPVVPAGIPPVPTVGMPPPDPAAFVPPSCIPPFGYPPAYPPPGWTGEPVVEEPMPNPPPDQPEWIKALISAPATESTSSEAKKPAEDPAVAKKMPAAEPAPTAAAAPTAPTTPAPTPKPEVSTISKALGLLGKRTFEKPPPGRSTGIISFIGPTFGYIMREDLEKFNFSFDAFFGNPKAMTAGVRVHFTQNSSIATDVKVAPGGTENLDPEIYEAVVSLTTIWDDRGSRVHANIGTVRTNVTFDDRDCGVTLLKNDHVLINLLIDTVTRKRRAANIKPKVPFTFKYTKEERELVTQHEQGAADAGQVQLQKLCGNGNFPEKRKENTQFVVFFQVQIKVEKMEEGEKGEVQGGQEVTLELKKEKTYEEVTKEKPPVAEVKTKSDVEVGRLVMTIDGQQKQLTFGPKDLLTTATMLDGDKVRFNIATHRETKEERATCVEILHDSFEESTEQRQHGIVIEFLEDSGLIKCTQNPQLFFHMSEVIEKKKLELNEKVEFSIVPVSPLAGFSGWRERLPDVRKEKPEAEKLKAVVKNLRAQDSKTNKKDYSATRRRYSRSQSRSRSRSPSRDQFGRIKKRCSSSVEREHRSSRQRRSRERLHKRTRSRSKSRSRSRSRSKSSSRSRSRSRERSKDRASKRRSKTNRDHEENHKRRRELSPPPRRGGIVDDELARKKRELEELNEMIAYKKSLVDPRGLEPGQRTCIDYDHGRIAVPLAEYKPVRSILKKRPDGPEYLHRPPYDDVYYDRPYSAYQDRSYSDPDRSYESHLYSESPYGGPPSTSRRYTDRYDVYDEPYDDRYYDPAYVDRPYDPYPPAKRSHSPEPRGLSPPSHAGKAHTASTHPPLSHSAATSSCQTSFRPPSPIDSPPRSPSPKLKEKKSRLSPPTEKPPLDRFLDMLNRKVDAEKNLGPVHVNDDLLPHERALQDGKGFSRIVGLAQEPPSISLAQEGQKRPPSPKRSSVEKTNEDPKTEPYDKIQSLLRTIGLKLSTGEVSKLASQAQEKVFSPRSSTERDTSSAPREELRTTRTGSLESDRIHSHSPVRSSSLEPLSRQKTNVSEYEDFLDQQELEAFKKAQQLQSLTKTMGSTATTTPSPKPPSGPPPAHYRHPTPPFNWPLGVTAEILPTQTSTSTVQSPAKPVKSVQFSLPTEPPLVETEDDIKLKQKEKVGFGSGTYKYILLKFPGKQVSSEPRNVWIVGHSLVYWAESRAKSPEVGMQLGMDPGKVTVWWKGTQGMTWSQLLPQLHQLKVTWPNPDVLILHLGGNDLSTDSPTDLLASVKKDLTSMRSIFPQCVLVWSNILPRRVWRHSVDSHEVDLVRTTVNRRIQNIISELGGTSLTHDNIRCGANTGLYRVDGVHLSQKGIDVFNLNLQDLLEKWEMEVNAASEKS